MARPENSCTISPRAVAPADGATYTVNAGRAAGAAHRPTEQRLVWSAGPSGYHRLCASSPMDTVPGWARFIAVHDAAAISQCPSALPMNTVWLTSDGDGKTNVLTAVGA